MVLSSRVGLERYPSFDATLLVFDDRSCCVYTFLFFRLLFELGHIIDVPLNEILMISLRFCRKRCVLLRAEVSLLKGAGLSRMLEFFCVVGCIVTQSRVGGCQVNPDDHLRCDSVPLLLGQEDRL